MARLDESLIATVVSNRFGIKFESMKDEYDGEIFSVIRPQDLEKPNGFSITITSTTRLIEAGFRADNFSGALLRTMGEATKEQISIFISAINNLKIHHDCELKVNGTLVESPSACFSDLMWSSFELTCDRRFEKSDLKDVTKLNEYASSITIELLEAVLALMKIEESENDMPLYEIGLPEGAKLSVTINKYERNPINRAKCLDRNGFSCKVCKFNFEEKYGEIGKSFVEVHHIIPVSKMRDDYIIDPANDLVPLCSNCHAMVHRKDPPYMIDELINYIALVPESNKKNNDKISSPVKHRISIDSEYE